MFSKKIKITIVLTIVIIASLQVGAVLLNNLYFEKVALTQAKKRSLSPHDANAIKHAYAASLVYSSFRELWFSQEMAKKSTILLGKINEMSETVFKPNRDSSLEMMKDMANNMMGISVGQWLECNNQSATNNRLSIIGDMAKEDVLILFRENLDLSEEEKQKAKASFEYSIANHWFDENNEMFKERAELFLASK